jgi:hypothetical protein
MTTTSTTKVFFLSVLAGLVGILALLTWIMFTERAGAHGPDAGSAPDLKNGLLPGHDVLVGVEGKVNGVYVVPRTSHAAGETLDDKTDASSRAGVPSSARAGTVPNKPK